MKMTKQYKSYLAFNNWDTTFIVHFPQHSFNKNGCNLYFQQDHFGLSIKKKKGQNKRNYNDCVLFHKAMSKTDTLIK